MRCLICNNNTIFLDKYKFNVKSDIEYFGDKDIFQCESCNFCFCHPMPKKIKLDEFYQKIYRAYGRPHEYDSIDVKKNYKSFKNLDYLDYLEKFIDLNKINKKFDLIISLHSLEHLTDLNIIHNFRAVAKKNSYLFLEVPNCEFSLKFKSRPYDSPHLMFFTKESFRKIAKKYSLEILDMSYCSISLEENFKNMSNAKRKYEDWKKGEIKDFIKSLLRKLLKKVKIFKTLENKEKKNYQENDKNLSNLRVLFKIK